MKIIQIMRLDCSVVCRSRIENYSDNGCWTVVVFEDPGNQNYSDNEGWTVVLF